jgi:thiol:disulfide interchange protein
MLQSLKWAVVVGLAGIIALAAGCGGPAQEQAGTSATGGGAEMAEEGEIAWSHDYEAGLAAARDLDKPAMVDVFATWCAPCKLLDENVFSRADVAAASEDFVTIRVDGDENPELVAKLGVSGYPTVLFLTPEGEEIGRSLGAVSYDVMLGEMRRAIERYAEGS